MRARYLLVLCMLALLVNAFSIYNYLLAICSLFLLLLLVIPNIFIKLTKTVNKLDESKQNFAVRQIGNYGKQKTTRKMNRLSMIFALIVVNVGAAGLIILTYLNLNETGNFISQHITWEGITPVLGVAGFILFIASVLLITGYAIKILRKEALFNV